MKIFTVRTILSLVVTHGWPLKQLNVRNVFLSDNLHEIVYMKQTKDYEDKNGLGDVSLLQKALYGLKKAPRALYL